MFTVSWWGKFVGGSFGLLVAGPVGALLGAAVGHRFDRAVQELLADSLGSAAQQRAQAAFFTATYLVMGHLAKADGRVSEREIAAARVVMAQMNLDPRQERLAIQLFGEGKQSEFSLDAVLTRFRHESQCRYNLVYNFIEIQLYVGYADGTLHPKVRTLLLHVCDRLNFSRARFEAMEATFEARSGNGRRGGSRRRGRQVATQRLSLADAYAVLGVLPAASDDEIKRSYRRLLNRHHPDKLVNKGLTEEMVRLASDKTWRIRAAYDRIKAARGW